MTLQSPYHRSWYYLLRVPSSVTIIRRELQFAIAREDPLEL